MNRSYLAFALVSTSFISTKILATSLITQNYTPPSLDSKAPWFTGSLVGPGVGTTDPLHFYAEPYLFFTSFTGTYNQKGKVSSTPNFYSLNFAVSMSTGITPFLDFGITPQGFYQFTQGKRSTELGDLSTGFNILLVEEDQDNWVPDIRLSLKTFIPLGRYDKLNPDKLLTDASGWGCWVPYTVLSAGKIISLNQGHFLIPKIGLGFLFPTGAPVKGFNTYGGGYGTRGTVYPGNNFWVDLAIEYNFTQKIACALDLVYEYQNKTRFSGNPGELAPGITAQNTQPFSENWSLAPGLEYNWSQNIGLIGGVWFSFAGKNSPRFLSGALSFSFYL